MAHIDKWIELVQEIIDLCDAFEYNHHWDRGIPEEVQAQLYRHRRELFETLTMLYAAKFIRNYKSVSEVNDKSFLRWQLLHHEVKRALDVTVLERNLVLTFFSLVELFSISCVNDVINGSKYYFDKVRNNKWATASWALLLVPGNLISSSLFGI